MNIGTDIIEIDRVEKSARNENFLRGVYTQSELEYCRAHGSKAQTLAGMFCAKEAVSKAVGTGFCGFRPCDIEILHGENGAPRVNLLGGAQKYNGQIKISISHCERYAVATAVYLGD